jgi:pantothenate kinase type III
MSLENSTTSATNGGQVGVEVDGGSGTAAAAASAAASASIEATTSNRIPYACWPDDAPFKSETKVMTIVVGHSSLHWALHEGANEGFFPVIFWKYVGSFDVKWSEWHSFLRRKSATWWYYMWLFILWHKRSLWLTFVLFSFFFFFYSTPHVDMDVVIEEEEPHCEILERHTAKQAHSLIFGDADEADIYTVSLAAAKRISPAISVYVISEDEEQERAILYMFEKVPSRIVRLRNTDFFPTEAGVYPSLGADLAAAMLAARNTYGENPTLVVDGNKAITFAAMNSSSRIIGGGVAAGISIRLRSLADTVSGMPRIRFSDLKEGIQKAKTDGGLPTFAKDTRTAIMSSACGEVATQLRNIVKKFVGMTKDDENGNGNDDDEEGGGFTVVVTGGDGKLLYELLEPDASGIVTVDSSLALPSKVNLMHKKNLCHYGIGSVLDAKCIERSEMYPENDLLYRVVGARVAKAFPAPDENNDFYKRGSVLYCNKKEYIDDHEFCIRYDENGFKEIWTLVDIYGTCLQQLTNIVSIGWLVVGLCILSLVSGY